MAWHGVGTKSSPWPKLRDQWKKKKNFNLIWVGSIRLKHESNSCFPKLLPFHNKTKQWRTNFYIYLCISTKTLDNLFGHFLRRHSDEQGPTLYPAGWQPLKTKIFHASESHVEVRTLVWSCMGYSSMHPSYPEVWLCMDYRSMHQSYLEVWLCMGCLGWLGLFFLVLWSSDSYDLSTGKQCKGWS